MQQPNMKVSKLINLEIGQWDVAKVWTTLSVEVASKTLQIARVSSTSGDKLIWALKKSSKFSVQSVYKLKTESYTHNDGENSNSLHIFLCWLWETKLSNKIKIMIWRACHEFLLTRQQLASKKIIPENTCDICKTALEDMLHANFGCQNIWLY